MFHPSLAFHTLLADTFFMQSELSAKKFEYRVALMTELRTRQARNPRYSLRSFARDLGVSVTALSDVLSGKRHFARKNAQQIIEKLGWSPLQAQSFIETVSGKPSASTDRTHLLLSDDLFHMISDWYYLVILNLAKIPSAKSSPKWVSQRLGITAQEAKEAIERLKRLGYLETQNGRLKRLIPTLDTSTEIPSAAIRKYHRQNFIVAERAQESVPFERRQISSFTVATDPERVKKAKMMLNGFMRKLEEVLESDNPTEVYTLSTQLFPAQLTKESSS